MTTHINKMPEQWPACVGCDLETTGLDPFVDRLLSIAFSDGKDTWVFLHFHGLEKLAPMFADPTIQKIFHNAKFDMKWIKHTLGVEVANAYDTFLAENVIHSGKGLPVGLIDLLARYKGVLIDKDVRGEFINHPGFHKTPITIQQLGYIVEDVIHLCDIKTMQMKAIEEATLGRALGIELEALPATVALELGGIAFDSALWEEQQAHFEYEIYKAEGKLRELVGNFVLEVPRTRKGEQITEALLPENINFNSPSQLKVLFEQRFHTELGSTRAELLEDMAEGRFKVPEEAQAAAQHILTIRKWVKRLGFNYPQFIHPATQKIHPEYHQLGARTGRFSCSSPNMQQVPRPLADEPNMRHLFTADSEDFVIIRADYRQQEPRVMAQLSGDPALIKACNTEDVYMGIGNAMYGYDIDPHSEERQIAKMFVLAVGYGAGTEKLSAASGKSVEVCTELRNRIRQRFPIMVQYASKMDRLLQQYGFVTTASGRRRYFSNKDKSFTQAVNTPVQGTAADMFKLSMARIHRFLTNEIKCGNIHSASRVLMVVHDEIEIHCHKDNAEYIAKNIDAIMVAAGKELCPKVSHLTEIAWNYRWDK